MTFLNVQFHATAEELGAFVLTIAADSAVDIVAVRYNPTVASRVHRKDLVSAVNYASVRRLLFTHGDATLTEGGGLALLDANEGALVLDIGREGPTSLIESRLSTSVPRAVWTNAFEELTRRTLAGAIGVNEKNGASAIYRSHRLSPGAIARSASGVSLRPFAGSPVVYHALVKDQTKKMYGNKH